jgi:hypothetical protein
MAGRGASVSLRAEEFRKHADECYRLSVRLRDAEHRSFALFLATAWLALAKQAEQKAAAVPGGTIPTVPSPPTDPQPTDPQPKDQID